jgi:hypothetical protein
MLDDDQDLGAVDLEWTVDSADDAMDAAFKPNMKSNQLAVLGPNPDNPNRVSAELNAISRLITRTHCEHLPYRRDSIALSAG